MACPKPQTHPSKLFDTGQLAALGEVDFDRFTNLASILKWFGSGFSLGTYNKLAAGNLGGEEWPKESYPIKPLEEIDTFVSYRGASGRFVLWCTLVARMNIKPTVIFCVLFLPFVALVMWSWVPEPIYYISKPFLTSLTFDFWAHKRSLFDSIYPGDRGWFLFIPLGCPLILIILWFWNPLGTFFLRHPRIWLKNIVTGKIFRHCEIRNSIQF